MAKKRSVYRPLFGTLPPKVEDRWDRLKAFIAAWDKPLGPPKGVPGGVWEDARRRLGDRLPGAVRGYYESGLYDWFRSKAGEPDAWVPPEGLGIDIGTGSVKFVAPGSKYDAGRAIPADRLGDDDPPVTDVFAPGSLDEALGPLNPTGLSFSAWLIREALGMASALGGARRSLESKRFAEDVDRIRRTFRHADLDGRQGDQEFTFYEGEDAVYYEVRYQVAGSDRFYAMLAARTQDALDRHLNREGA